VHKKDQDDKRKLTNVGIGVLEVPVLSLRIVDEPIDHVQVILHHHPTQNPTSWLTVTAPHRNHHQKGSAGGGLTTCRLASNLSRRSDACAGEGARGQIRPRAGREIEIEREREREAEGGNGGD